MDGNEVVVTGTGLATPLGLDAAGILRKIRSGTSAAAPPSSFDPSAFDCPVCAEVRDFNPLDYITEAKLCRLMNRDAQLAVAAARLALRDAAVRPGETYAPENIALFGASGLAGLPLREVERLVARSLGSAGGFDLARFGAAGLKAVSPLLSFKILGNMPLCFVSINEGIQGPNAIYTPWEGHGAQAVEAGIRALRNGIAECALVGGCDVKTHELAFATLQQLGLFEDWRRPSNGNRPSTVGAIPGEGAAFLVLETARTATKRGARIHARIGSYAFRSRCGDDDLTGIRSDILRQIQKPGHTVTGLGSASNRDLRTREEALLNSIGRHRGEVLHPKLYMGDLFAAAAPAQVALACSLAGGSGGSVLATCFGHGSTQAAFILNPP